MEGEDKLKGLFNKIKANPEIGPDYKDATYEGFKDLITNNQDFRRDLHTDLTRFKLIDPTRKFEDFNKNLEQNYLLVPQPPAVSLAPPQRQSIEQQAAGQATGFVPPMAVQPEQPVFQPFVQFKNEAELQQTAKSPVFKDYSAASAVMADREKMDESNPLFAQADARGVNYVYDENGNGEPIGEYANKDIADAVRSQRSAAPSGLIMPFKDAETDFAKMSPEQQAQAIAGSTGSELERKKANEKRSGLQKIKDFGKTLGGIATNAYDAILASEKLLGAKQRDLLTFGGAEENLKKVKQQVISSMGKIENEYAQELRDNNIETSLVDVINKGELSKLPEAIGYNVANAIVSGLGAAFTGGYSMFAQTLAQDYKSGVENLAKETNRTPEQVIADGDDAELIPAISATIQGLIEKAQIGLASKAIDSKGAYKYIRDLVVKNTGNSKWAKAAGAGLGLGVASLESGAQGAAQEVASIASEEAAGSDSFNKFYNKLGKTLSSEAGQKRLTESLVGEAIGAGGLIAGGRFGANVLGGRSPSVAPSQLGGIPTQEADPNDPAFQAEQQTAESIKRNQSFSKIENFLGANTDNLNLQSGKSGEGKSYVSLAKGLMGMPETSVEFNDEENKTQNRLDLALEIGKITQKEYYEKSKELERNVLQRGLNEHKANQPANKIAIGDVITLPNGKNAVVNIIRPNGTIQVTPQVTVGVDSNGKPQTETEKTINIDLQGNVVKIDDGGNVIEQPSETTYETVTPEELQAFRQGQIDPERAAAIADDVALIQSGQMDINSIDDPNYRLMVESAMGAGQQGQGTAQNVSLENKVKETESKIKNKGLFLAEVDENGNRVVDKETGRQSQSVGEIISQSDDAPVPTSVREINGIEFVEFSNPRTGDVDVIVTGKNDGSYVGYYRLYDNGKPTNQWSSKFENPSRNKEDFKTMISGVQSMLPEGHEYTEKTSISTDGLRVWEQQLGRGYELQTDENGNIITNKVAINGDAIVNELGIDVDKGSFENISVRNNTDIKKVRQALLPYLQKLGLNESNIYFENGTAYIDLPVLKKKNANATPQSETIVADQAAQNMGTAVNQPLETGAAAVEVGESGRPVVEVEGDQVVEEEKPLTKEQQINALRAKEQAEYDAMSDPNDEAKRDEIYDRYDKLISPLLGEKAPKPKGKATIIIEEKPKEPLIPKQKLEKIKEKVKSDPNVLLRTGRIEGKNTGFFAIPEQGGPFVDDSFNDLGVNEETSAYTMPNNFKVKDLSNMVFDDYKKNKEDEKARAEGYDGVKIMEMDGTTVMDVVNPKKLIKLDESLPELRNEKLQEASSKTRKAEGGQSAKQSSEPTEKKPRKRGRSINVQAAMNVQLPNNKEAAVMQTILENPLSEDILQSIFGGPDTQAKSGRKSIKGERSARISMLKKNGVKSVGKMAELAASKLAEWDGSPDAMPNDFSDGLEDLVIDTILNYNSKESIANDLLAMANLEQQQFDEQWYAGQQNEDLVRESEGIVDALTDEEFVELLGLEDEGVAEFLDNWNEERAESEKSPEQKEAEKIVSEAKQKVSDAEKALKQASNAAGQSLNVPLGEKTPLGLTVQRGNADAQRKVKEAETALELAKSDLGKAESQLDKLKGKKTSQLEIDTKGTPKALRFEEGKKLTPEEKRKVLGSMQDSYKLLKRPYTIEDTERGERKVWLDNARDYMQTSDVTGAKIRWSIQLPSGKTAHPTEVYGNISNDDIKSAERSINMNQDEADFKYKKVVDMLTRENEIESVVEVIQTALKYGASFKKTFDSNDIGERNPSVDLRFPPVGSEVQPRTWSIVGYAENADKPILGITKGKMDSREARILSNSMDWERFYNEFGPKPATQPTTEKPPTSPLTPFQTKDKEGQAARAALKESVGQKEFKRLENIAKNGEKILRDLESRNVLKIDCP